ncbi:MAG: AAA family ATPase, partial [Clostridia bacterium]|nr:AAA family ATPase [Clostridia bacterium]
MKNGSGKNKIAKTVALIILIVGVFALLVFALLRQYGVYDGNFPALSSGIKYLFLAFLLLLPVLLIILIILTFTKRSNTDLITPLYFDVDFKKLEGEKQPLRSFDAPKLANVDGFTLYTNAPAREGSSIAPTARSAAPAAGSSTDTDGEESVGGSRFYMLTEIDKEYANYVRPDYDDKITLRELCEEFRNFSAGKLKLYYDIEDIRRFIGALAVTKLIILQGMSGTGKTSLAYAFGEFLENKTVVVPIQPMWKERTDLVGYYNEFTKRFNETTLLYKMYEANNNEEIYITVLDEMNIARVEYYFAEFLSLLEIPNPDGRNLDVVADRWEDDPKLLQHNGKLRLPTNMWFVGTANNDDSTFSISDKVYDRAMVLNLDKKA